jgi:hypothetical protein
MLRLALIFLVAAAPAVQEKPRPPIDKALIERFRSLTPEQKARLKERVESLRQLPPAERVRLAENLEKFRALAPERQKALRERVEKMDPEERRKSAELAAGFFRWMRARYGQVRFPRQAFFRWAAARRTPVFQGLKDLDPGPRTDALLRLAHDYRTVLTQQMRQHSRRHGCVPENEIQSLEELNFGEFWEAAEQIKSRCPSASKAPAGPPREKRDR